MAVVVAGPAKKHVAGRLKHSLAGDDSLPLVRIAALAGIGFEHGWLSLLALQDQGIVRSCHQQCNRTARPDAAPPDDFAGNINKLVTIQNDAPFFRQSPAIPSKHLTRMFSES